MATTILACRVEMTAAAPAKVPVAVASLASPRLLRREGGATREAQAPAPSPKCSILTMDWFRHL
jgi:hypothetical protein